MPTPAHHDLKKIAAQRFPALGKEHDAAFRHVQQPDLRGDCVLANPPFNDSDPAQRGSSFLQGEAKPQVVSEAKDNFRKDDVLPKDNANFAWVQHFIHHLAPQGMAGFVLAIGSMSSNLFGEGEIRNAIIEADLVDCMVAQ